VRYGTAVQGADAAGAWLQASDTDAMPLPKAGMLGIPSVPLAADVIRVIGLGAALRAQLDLLLPGVIGSRETTLGGLVRRRMGARVVERLVAPVTMGVHSRHPDSLDVDAVAPGLRAGLKNEESLASAVRVMRAAAPAGSAVSGIRGGVSRLVTALVSALERFGVEVRYGTAVQGADAAGVTLADGSRLTARAVVVAAPDRGLTQREGTWPDAEESRIALATLVVRSQELDRAPRGTGVLVAEGCSTITAKALTHSSAKWAWLGEKAGEHRHVLRLSYDARRVEKHDETAFLDQAISDATKLLGTRLSRGDVLGFARTDWVAGTPDRRPTDDGVARLGETVAGTGLAAVVGHAQREARALAARLAGDVAS